jgi:hypothetical protein
MGLTIFGPWALAEFSITLNGYPITTASMPLLLTSVSSHRSSPALASRFKAVLMCSIYTMLVEELAEIWPLPSDGFLAAA